MSADRLSYTPSLLPHNVSAFRLRGGALARRGEPLLARRGELVTEQVGRVVYYANTDEHAATGERPLLLLHGMHLGAGAQELALLFDAFRGQRHVCAPDLPGFGASDGGADTYLPEHYASVITQLIELCACDLLSPVDVVAVGLTCEHAARAVASLPEMVSSLTLIAPTGFAHERDVGVLERLARGGNALLPSAVLKRLGLARFCGGGFASVLSGSAFPAGNPQAVYTRVHCPTLVLHTGGDKARYSTLARFVRWREHYSASELPSLSLGDGRVVARVTSQLEQLFGRAAEPAPLRLHAN